MLRVIRLGVAAGAGPRRSCFCSGNTPLSFPVTGTGFFLGDVRYTEYVSVARRSDIRSGAESGPSYHLQPSEEKELLHFSI